MLASAPIPPADDDGYRLWLRYEPLAEGSLRDAYRKAFTGVDVDGASATLRAARDELGRGLSSMLGLPNMARASAGGSAVVAGTPDSSHIIARLGLGAQLAQLGDEGFLVKQVSFEGRSLVAVAANRDLGVLYGAFHLLRAVATQRDPQQLEMLSAPRVRHRLLDHWDNLDGSVERGYAGQSLWDWHKLPDYVSPRYTDYARANASIGINGSVLTNVNANARVLTPAYLAKVAALAEVFRPYGVRVFLTARFSAPIEIGGLETADPLDARVLAFWQAKVHEIYRYVPDFGGFLVKANSEGQPGPQRYERSHADGANLLAEALAPHGGIVMWRAFVYDNDVPEDRAKQAYNEFRPLDGQFKKNVVVQVKNGAIDFQPREPFHPLFGAMPKTPLALEVQLTQEYLGCATHLCYLAPMFSECLDADTHASGAGSLLAQVVDGTLDGHELSAMCAVSNIGAERNWCGHPFAQSNWYAFGRLAWDHRLSPASIAEEWVRATFSNDQRFVAPVKQMMLDSREAVVSYMTPLGLHHLMAWDHHYGPGPWIDQGRADWTSVYFHRADSAGVGFDRSASGSDAVGQYHAPVAQLFGDSQRCPQQFLLWFHHVAWSARLPSGRTLWQELCFKYQAGVESVRSMQKTWQTLEGLVDRARFVHVRSLLTIQEKEARWWRDSCLLYFQTFSGLPFPPGSEPAERTLEEYRRIVHHYVPGTPRPVV
ncbi:MAG: alpha-glucuronidase family glycosyl hydrolase [Polyangiaceae bacterium]